MNNFEKLARAKWREMADEARRQNDPISRGIRKDLNDNRQFLSEMFGEKTMNRGNPDDVLFSKRDRNRLNDYSKSRGYSGAKSESYRKIEGILNQHNSATDKIKSGKNRVNAMSADAATLTDKLKSGFKKVPETDAARVSVAKGFENNLQDAVNKVRNKNNTQDAANKAKEINIWTDAVKKSKEGNTQDAANKAKEINIWTDAVKKARSEGVKNTAAGRNSIPFKSTTSTPSTKSKWSTGKKIGVGAGVALSAAGLAYGGSKLYRKIKKKREDKNE